MGWRLAVVVTRRFKLHSSARPCGPRLAGAGRGGVEPGVSIRAAVRAATGPGCTDTHVATVSIRAAVRAATQILGGDRVDIDVSIRAAVRAATAPAARIRCSRSSFYPRGRAGRDGPLLRLRNRGSVSIRAAVRAATVTGCVIGHVSKPFLSARPCGPRHDSSLVHAVLATVSIRAAVRAATSIWDMDLDVEPVSIRAAVRAATTTRETTDDAGQRFYPRGRAGRDPATAGGDSPGAGFYPRGRAGRDIPGPGT